jgi:hypothetical protein
MVVAKKEEQVAQMNAHCDRSWKGTLCVRRNNQLKLEERRRTAQEKDGLVEGNGGVKERRTTPKSGVQRRS